MKKILFKNVVTIKGRENQVSHKNNLCKLKLNIKGPR